MIIVAKLVEKHFLNGKSIARPVAGLHLYLGAQLVNKETLHMWLIKKQPKDK